MLRKALFICLLAASALFATVANHGALRVVDGIIVDKNGNPPQLRGMSLFWNQWSEGSAFYNASTVSTLAGSSWRANVVRAAIGDGNTSHAQTIIDAAISNGIYVIVDWHVHTMNVNSAKTFFQTISQYVKNKGNPPNVIYEVFNEPTTQTWASIKSDAEQIISTIRANDPNNLIIVGVPNYSSQILAPRGNMINGTNIAYAFHFYASETSHGAYRNNVNQAICAKIPIFITEWGVSPASGKCNSDGNVDGSREPLNIDWSMVATWVNFIENRKLSWVNWAISNKNECSSTKLSPMSASGQYVSDLISKRNQGQSHKDVTTMTFDPCPEEQGPQTGGSSTIGTDTRMEAENYASHTGAGSKREEANVVGDGAYLGTLTTGSKTTYELKAPKDTIVVLSIYYRSTNGATIKVSDGQHAYTVNLPARSAWGGEFIAPGQFGVSTTLTIEVTSGSLDADYYAWRRFNYGDPNANPPTLGDLEKWPDVANYGSTPIRNVQILFSDAPKFYYDLKGKPLGSSLPKSQGIYILKQGNVSRMVVVK
jgi:endoglucanase